MSAVAKLEAKIFVEGEIVAETGMHIGGNSIGMAIGGADSVVVRNPVSNEPYIPGSSLRGKMRSLLERVRGDENFSESGGFSITKDGVLAGRNPETDLGRFFGTAPSDKDNKAKVTPTRLTVRDCPLTKASADELNNAPNTDMPMTEVKTEVWIDRITSAANPRQIERVPAGAAFGCCFVIDLLEGDDEQQWLNLLAEGMRLLEADSLGGSGSRGYGQVSFKVSNIIKRPADWYRGNKASEVDLSANFQLHA